MTPTELENLSDSEYLAFVIEHIKWDMKLADYRRLLSIVRKLQDHDSQALLKEIRK